MNVTLIVLVSIATGFLGFIYLSNPLVLGGSSTYDDFNGYKDIVLDLYNEGISNVLIKEVLINNQAGNVDLGISYDLQYVQSHTDNESIKFYELGEKVVNPKKVGEQVIYNKEEITPIHYGIRIKNFKEPIKSITIKYKYLGLPVSKEIKIKMSFN